MKSKAPALSVPKVACSLLRLPEKTTYCHKALSWHHQIVHDNKNSVDSSFLLIPYNVYKKTTASGESSQCYTHLLVALPLEHQAEWRVYLFQCSTLILHQNVKPVSINPNGPKPLKMYRISLSPDFLSLDVALRFFDPVPALAFSWAEFPWPYLFIDLPSMNKVESVEWDTLEKLARRGLRAAAEWNILNLLQQRHQDVDYRDKIRALARRYYENATESSMADAVVSSFVIPLSNHVRPLVTAATKRAALTQDAIDLGVKRVVLWETMDNYRSMIPWIQAARIMGKTCASVFFNSLGPAASNTNTTIQSIKTWIIDQMRQHDDRFAHRLPPGARAWIVRLIQDVTLPDSDVTTFESLAELWGIVHMRMRSDVTRWAVTRIPFPEPGRTTESEQLFNLFGPYATDWDRCVNAIRMLSPKNVNGRVSHWATLALSVCPEAGDLVFDREAQRAKDEWEEQKRFWQQSRARALSDGTWMPPSNEQERIERQAAIAPFTRAQLARLFIPGTETLHLPPCLVSLMTRIRTQHHICNEDRQSLARWLVDLYPDTNDGTMDPQQLQLIAEFAHAVPEGSTRVSNNIMVFVGALNTALKEKQEGRIPRGCNKIIHLTRSVVQTEPRYACRCPYANQIDTADGSIKGCVAECTENMKQRTGDETYPRMRSPMDHLLMAHEKNRCVASLLDW